MMEPLEVTRADVIDKLASTTNEVVDLMIQIGLDRR